MTYDGKRLRMTIEFDIHPDMAESALTSVRDLLMAKNVIVDHSDLETRTEESPVRAKKLKHLIAMGAYTNPVGKSFRAMRLPREDGTKDYKVLEFGSSSMGDLTSKESTNLYVVDTRNPADMKAAGERLNDDKRWDFYDLHYAGRGGTHSDGSGYSEFLIGEVRPKSFAIRLIEYNYPRVFHWYANNRFGLKYEDVPREKAERYIALFKKYLKTLTRRSDAYKVFDTLANKFSERWTFDENVRRGAYDDAEWKKDHILTKGRYDIMEMADIDDFTDIMAAKMQPRDAYEMMDKSQYFKSSAGGDVRQAAVRYFFAKFGLVTEMELRAANDEKSRARFLARSMYSVGRTEYRMSQKAWRLASDSWSNQILRKVFDNIRSDLSSSMIRGNDPMDEDQLKEYLLIAHRLINRYGVIKELPAILSMYSPGGAVDRALRPLILSALEHYGPRDRMALNSIIAADPRFGGQRLFADVPDQFPRLRRIIMETKLKR